MQQDETAPVSEGILLCVALFACVLVYNATINAKFHNLVRTGTRTRSLLVSLIYEKSLRLASSGGTGVGATTNLMSNDCERIFEMQLYLHCVFRPPSPSSHRFPPPLFT